MCAHLATGGTVRRHQVCRAQILLYGHPHVAVPRLRAEDVPRLERGMLADNECNATMATNATPAVPLDEVRCLSSGAHLILATCFMGLL